MAEKFSMIGWIAQEDILFPWSIYPYDKALLLKQSLEQYSAETSGLGSTSPWALLTEDEAIQLVNEMKEYNLIGDIADPRSALV